MARGKTRADEQERSSGRADNGTEQGQASARSTAQRRFREKFGATGYQFPQRIRRCFMTGKQCIFSSPQESSPSGSFRQKAPAPARHKPFSVFVIMPFRPTLDTFYEWSLKRYLRDGFSITDKDMEVHRADEFRDIGYVMCEKICRRIQEADLVVVDLSIENPNAMYEMGIAVGLCKPLLIMCNRADRGRLSEGYLQSLGLKKDTEQFEIVTYPSVGYLASAEHDPVDAAGRIELKPRMANMKIVPLLVQEGTPVRYPDDISATFSEALRGAIGVAAAQIAESEDRFPSLQEAVKILTPEGITDLGTLTERDEINIVGADRKMMSFWEVARHVDRAFVCIVDLAGENPHSYFWLGYCHGRGINAVPISRCLPNRCSSDASAAAQTTREADGNEEDEHPEKKAEHAIAFDIRALWYIRYQHDRIQDLSKALKAALEELIAKDVPRQQRNVFWERLTRHPRIHIYTGAVHHRDLKREVVGDWDQRTVSELVRYLSSAEESVVPELERPIYSPGTIKGKLAKDWAQDKSLEAYISLIRQELTDKNCIIVASADVNPLTEVVLARAYGVKTACFKDPQSHEIAPNKKRGVVIALKGWQKDDSDRTEDVDTIPTFFSRSGRKEHLDERKRGFLVNANSKPLQELYKSQDEVSYDEEEFSLLSHLVVMQNPFCSEGNRDAIIVLLNGVSGPGTFGLAEVLTGGRDTDKAIESEKLLKEVNRLWAKGETEESSDQFGVEGIVKVKVDIQSPRKSSACADGDTDAKTDSSGVDDKSAQAVQDKFYDLREVGSWQFYEQKQLMEDNPRLFRMSQ